MQIRPVRPEEAGRLRELRLRALEDAPEVFFSSLESERRLPVEYWESWAGTVEHRIMFVAVDGTEWVGMAGASRHPERSDTVSLWWLWVAPAARGRGLARRFLEVREDWARRCGAARLELAVAETNTATRALYRRLGFEPTGERRSMVSDPSRVGIVMARPL
jgi:ribosomal protein S18 acetylase RimI-like enzyme